MKNNMNKIWYMYDITLPGREKGDEMGGEGWKKDKNEKRKENKNVKNITEALADITSYNWRQVLFS
jgi:hypothetical protein